MNAFPNHFSRVFGRLTIFMFVGVIFASCTPEEEISLLITLVADGRERSFQQPAAITVGEFLNQAELEVLPPDEVEPPIFTQLADGMRITVVRVSEENVCNEIEIPYRTRNVMNESLEPDEERLAQGGQVGSEQVCYRVQIRDGVRQEPIEVSRVTLVDAQDQVIYVGPSGEIDAVGIEGTLSYLSGNNVWIIRGDSTAKTQLTDTNDVDGLVFDSTPDGERLLFTRSAADDAPESQFNRLWMIGDTIRGVSPIALQPENVLYAGWIPNQPNTISYSTAERTEIAPGWDADNNLWLMELDMQSGTSLGVDELIPSSLGGLDGWWGTDFIWSPSGEALAWVRADSMGVVDLGTGALSPLLSYRVFETRQPWSWRASVSWSPDESLLLTTVHGLPIGSEPPETSPAFHVAATDRAGTFNAEIGRNAGIWSMPQYAPIAGGEVAYLLARDLSNNVSPNAEYDLIIADRDGSNTEVIFPQPGEPGLHADAALTWNPDGTQIAFIYSGNLWIIDVQSRLSYQLTLDGGASHPIWTR